MRLRKWSVNEAASSSGATTTAATRVTPVVALFSVSSRRKNAPSSTPGMAFS